MIARKNMSDTSSDLEDTIQTPAKKARISSPTNNSQQAPAVMNFAGHSPTKTSAIHLKPPISNSTTQQNYQDSQSATPNITTPQIELDHSQEISSNMDILKKLLEGQTNMQSQILSSVNQQNELSKDIKTALGALGDLSSNVTALQTTLTNFGDRVETEENDLQEKKSSQEDLKEQLEKMTAKFRDMKDAQLKSMERTFDNYLILKGIPEKETETALELKQQVNQLIAQKIGIIAPCTSAVRVGKINDGTRPARVYWTDQTSKNAVLRNSKRLLPIKTSKDLPKPVREVQLKIKAKGWEVRREGVEFLYHDLGLIINGTFVHHEDLILENSRGGLMDTR